MNRLFAGPELARGAESFAEHNARLGHAPIPRKDFIHVLANSGLTGRGGAGFPVAVKWKAVAAESRERAVILVNGAEGEPQSKKDRLLMTTRPHLILDGAFIAARHLDARRVVLYLGQNHHAARSAMVHAVAERAEHERRMVSTIAAPARYVAGQESAAIHMINAGVATPTTTPPLPFERGIDGLPTLVHNVETLAHIALIARMGSSTGTTLVTLAGAVIRPGVVEVETSKTLADVISLGGGSSDSTRAILIGGYFGSWVDPREVWSLRLESTKLGCGVIGVLSDRRCPVCETAGIMRYLALESSAQCGPCFFGLRALADGCTRIADEGANSADLARLQRWAIDVRGRGACRHPDGAVAFLQSALTLFKQEFTAHSPHRAAKEVSAA